mmetsp:Transcript_39389/g.93230  ORF Transcript_39389/g.93230 Transcript_39389/m.93230 type:complete len:82 (+) Transcript_39389:516-761(+)
MEGRRCIGHHRLFVDCTLSDCRLSERASEKEERKGTTSIPMQQASKFVAGFYFPLKKREEGFQTRKTLPRTQGAGAHFCPA